MKIAMIMLAAGNSRRFGTNKLLYEVNGMPMYRHVLGQLIQVKNHLKESIRCEITVITQYDTIAETVKEQGIQVLYNRHPEQGISSSLKIGLAACYPVPEYRKLGDLDLYLADPADLSNAQAVLESSGYVPEEELNDHHLVYRYTFPKTGRRFLLELHYRVVGQYQYNRANQLVDSIYSPTNLKKSTQTIHGYAYTVFPPTEYVFYMIHHMLKHYLYSGFGIRLLCDFTFYLKCHENEIDFHRIHEWCRESRISHLYEIILECCRKYLGLPDSIDDNTHYSQDDCQDFITQILKDGDMGTDISQSLIGSSSYQKINFFTYFKEGHIQMKVRFPRARRFPLLWPALWIITFLCFIRNTYTVRNTTLRQTLHDFKKSNQKTKLVKIFENSDS